MRIRCRRCRKFQPYPINVLRFGSAPSGSVHGIHETPPRRIRLRLFKSTRFDFTHFIPHSAQQAKEHFIYFISFHKMPLDPVIAVALAGNVMQFIDFGCRLLSKSIDLYHSFNGISAENSELEFVARDVQDLISPLRLSAEARSTTPAPDSLEQSTQISPAASTILSVLKSCDAIANELLSAVEELKVKNGPHRK
jgi:hypothetical protein